MKPFRVVTVVLLMVVIMAADLYAAAAGRLTHLEGQVMATGADGKARPIKAGSEVMIADVIATKPKAKAEITFSDQTRLRLAENTRLTITDYMATADQSRMRIDLDRGVIESRVHLAIGRIFGPKALNRFEVYTPTAAVGVRGTRFFSAHLDGITQAAFTEGFGYGFARNLPDKVMDVAAGQALTVTSVDTAPTVQPATEEQLRRFVEQTAPAGLDDSQLLESQIQDTGATLISHPVHNWFEHTGPFSLDDAQGGRGHYFDLTVHQERQSAQLADMQEQQAGDPLGGSGSGAGGRGGGGGGGCGGH